MQPTWGPLALSVIVDWILNVNNRLDEEKIILD